MKRNVSGRPSKSARPGRRHTRRRSRSPACIPSVKSTLKSAISARCSKIGPSASTSIRPSASGPAR